MRTPRAIRAAALLMTVFLAVPAAAQEQPAYPNAPEDLKRLVEGTLVGAMAEFNARGASEGIGRIALSWDEMVLLAAADATAVGMLVDRKLFVYRNLGETARTDKQVGALAGGSGSTSLIEKAGIPLLLAYAIEHGAIQQEVNGTSLTLSSSPYSWFVLGTGGDTATNYDKYNLWTRVGLSATFNVEQGQTPSVTNIGAKQLSEYSVRVRLLGDRNTRSKKFQRMWDSAVGKHIQSRVNKVSEGLVLLFRQGSQQTPLFQQSERTKAELLAELHRQFGSRTSLAEADNPAIADLILKALHSGVFLPVRSGQIPIPDNVKKQLHDEVLPTLGTLEGDLQEAREKLDTELESFYKTALLTFSYTNHRTPMGSDYNEFKLVFERKVAPFEITANAGVSIYNKPDRAIGQERVRDFHFSGALEGHSASPFKFTANDLSKMTYSVSGRYERMKENGADIGVVQGKVDIPLGAGLSLPLSFTYATRTELIDEKEVRGNFGLSFDLDKLYSLFRRLPPGP